MIAKGTTRRAKHSAQRNSPANAMADEAANKGHDLPTMPSLTKPEQSWQIKLNHQFVQKGSTRTRLRHATRQHLRDHLKATSRQARGLAQAMKNFPHIFKITENGKYTKAKEKLLGSHRHVRHTTMAEQAQHHHKRG